MDDHETIRLMALDGTKTYICGMAGNYNFAFTKEDLDVMSREVFAQTLMTFIRTAKTKKEVHSGMPEMP